MDRKTDILSVNELHELKKELRTSYFTSLTMLAMLLIFLHLILFLKTERWTIPSFEILVLIGSATIFYFATRYFTREIRDEIQGGYKIIEHKQIERKYDFMDKQDRLSSEFRKFIIIAGGQEFVVTEEQYKKAEVSDILAIYLTPKREKRIKIEIEK